MGTRRPAIGLVKLEQDAQRVDDARRKVLADWCRLVGHRVSGTTAESDPAARLRAMEATESKADTRQKAASKSLEQAVADLGLPPRSRQVLAGLLGGSSEKQIARDLSISPHTVHTYVKQIHKRLNVASRGELLSHFLDSRNTN